MLSLLFAASFTFTASATGVEKGTPLEFMFADKDTDRAYETMFLIDRPIADFKRELEKSGIPVGRPQNNAKCDLWPVGCTIELEPAITNFVNITVPEGIVFNPMIYTGGSVNEKGQLDAAVDMPGSVMAFYSLPQSLFVMNGLYPQGEVYSSFKAERELKKGEKVNFTIRWNADSMPKKIDVVFNKTNAADIVRMIKSESERHPLDVKVGFDGSLTVDEAAGIASVLDGIESVRVKINGINGNGFFFRAFNPPIKWRDRQNRLAQPFELTIDESSATLVFIDEDWTVEGDDPKLTPKVIKFSDTTNYPKTDTCFIYATGKITLKRLVDVRNQLAAKYIRNWYIFSGK